VHVPQGTPAALALRYPGLAPSGPLPESVDFALRRVDEPQRYRVVLFADTQPQTAAEVDYVRDDVAAELVGIDAAFGITLGDIMYDDLSLFARQCRVIGRIGIPWYHVPGNHDVNALAPDDRYSLETFKRLFGPTDYSFDYGRVHYVALDDVYYMGTSAGSDDAHPRGVGEYEGRIGEAQLRWLANDLRHVPGDRLVVLAMHIPLRSYEFPDQARMNVEGRDELFRVLAGRERVLVVAGHLHVAEHHYFDRADGWAGASPLHEHALSAVSGSWWSGPFDERGIPTTEQRDGSPNGYYVMDVDGNTATLRFHAAGKPADDQMRILLDAWFYQYSESARRDYRAGQLTRGAITREQLPATDVVVNLFDGGPRSVVELRVDERPAVAMRRVVRNDPFAEELIQRNQDTIKSWLRISPSSHVWVADLPPDLASGAHTLSVRAVDDYGQEHHGRRIIEILVP